MALEAVVFPQDLFGFSMELYNFEERGEMVEAHGGGRDMRGLLGGGVLQDNSQWDSSNCTSLVRNFEECDINSSSPETATAVVSPATAPGRRKRQRTKRCKNSEEVESQRMTHIAVERNRRKLMNEYLSMLRSIMPNSYVQRGDQASIVGGAINYVKELEQHLQSLEAQKRMELKRCKTITTTTKTDNGSSSSSYSSAFPFEDFFTFPQYSPRNYTNESTESHVIEVSMVESHVSLKVLSRRRPKQLLKMVVGLQSLRLTTLHLNLTTADEMVLYSFNLKVEEDCKFTSVDEIAAVVHQMVGMIQDQEGGAIVN